MPVSTALSSPRRAQPSAERERDVRMLASLTRCLCDLQALRKSDTSSPRASQDADPDRLPEDIDALRRELNARLNGMVAGASWRRERQT